MEHHYDPVVFDLDGTILDSAPIIVRALEEACASAGITVPDGANLERCVGPPLEVVLPQVLGSRIDTASLISIYREIYRPLAERETVLMPGVLEVLTTLSGRGVKVAIATYKPIELAGALLRSCGIAHFFELCGGRTSPEDRRSKTDILGDVLEALSPHDGSPLYIGDHEEDRLAAESLAVDFVAYTTDTPWDEIGRRVLGISEGDDDRSRNDAASR